MIIERTEDEVIFRLPADIRLEDLQALTDWFKYLELSRKSRATQQDVDNLVSGIKKGRWERRKSVLIK